jgi:hypothetical protein
MTLDLGRWLTLDPLFSNFPWQSPYCAFDNNPIYFTDPLGLAAEGGDDKKEDQLDKGKMGAEDTPFELHEITVTATRGSVTQTPANQDDITKSDNKETWAMRNGSWSSTCMCYSFNGASQQYWDEVENTKKALYTASWVTVGSIGGAMALPATLSLTSSHFAKSTTYALADASLQYSISGNIDYLSLVTNYVPGYSDMRMFSQSITLGKYIAFRGGVAVLDGMVDFNSDKFEFKTIFNKKTIGDGIFDAIFSFGGQMLPDVVGHQLNYQPKLRSSNVWDTQHISTSWSQAIGFGLYIPIIPMNDSFKKINNP